MKKPIHSALIGETCDMTVLDSGLTVMLCEKPGKTAYAVFGTRYGSVNTVGGQDDPAGIAHFLEHKLFESEEGDAFTRFRETGASANAYTSFDRTCYLFSASSRFEENLAILLDFVTHPYFSEKTVQKEQGIIGQEVKMYQDNPSWCGFFGMLKSLYGDHPVTVPIAGTVESIARITPELLYRHYAEEYTLSNMFVCIAGNFSKEAVMRQLQALSQEKKPHKATVQVARPVLNPVREISRLPIQIPEVHLGWHDGSLTRIPTAHETAVRQVTAEALFGDCSSLKHTLIKEGLANDSFEADYLFGPNYRVFAVSTEAVDPDRVIRRVREGLTQICKRGVDGNEVRRAARRLYGASVCSYTTAEDTAGELVEAAVNGFEPFSLCEEYLSVTPEEVAAVLDAFQSAPAESVVLPLG